MTKEIEFTASRNPQSRRWTGIAWINGSQVLADTSLAAPNGYPTRREALEAIKARV